MSQFAGMAAALQRQDGVHIVADRRDYVAKVPPAEGGLPDLRTQHMMADQCYMLPNTLKFDDLGARLRAASGDATAFFAAGTRTGELPVCSWAEPQPTALEVATWMAGCVYESALEMARLSKRREKGARKPTK